MGGSYSVYRCHQYQKLKSNWRTHKSSVLNEICPFVGWTHRSQKPTLLSSPTYSSWLDTDLGNPKLSITFPCHTSKSCTKKTDYNVLNSIIWQPNLSEKLKVHLSFPGWILQFWFWTKGIVLFTEYLLVCFKARSQGASTNVTTSCSLSDAIQRKNVIATKWVHLSRNCLFERINSLQCYESTRRCSHLLFT